MGFHSLTTTTHAPNVSLLSSGQQVTARLSARKVSVTGGNRAQDPLVRDTTMFSLLPLGYKPVQHIIVLNTVSNCNTMVIIIIL